MEPSKLHLISPPKHWADAPRLFCANLANSVARSTSNPLTFEREPERHRCGNCNTRSAGWRAQHIEGR